MNSAPPGLLVVVFTFNAPLVTLCFYFPSLTCATSFSLDPSIAAGPISSTVDDSLSAVSSGVETSVYIPMDTARLEHAAGLLRQSTKPVTMVEIHEALLTTMKAAALRDSYSTVRDVLSDVPLAIMCLPAANPGALEEVVGCLVALRDVFTTQVCGAVATLLLASYCPGLSLRRSASL